MLEVGDRAPDFALPDATGSLVRFYDMAGGRPTVLLLPGGRPALGSLVDALSRREEFAAYVIAAKPVDVPANISRFIDADGAVASRFRDGPDADVIVVLDPALRIAGVLTGDVPPASVIALLESAVHDPARPLIAAQAPLLIVPQVLSANDCARLVEQCRASAVPTGVELSTPVGRENALDATHKRRRDVTVDDTGQVQQLAALVGRRIMPEVRRAFAFRATRFEGFKIASYDDASGGFFAPHRDNLTPATAHRVFGLSINLNDDYDGGELAFPEYGNQRYRAPAGGAMVFSCDLLHAVHPVARGTRFVLLSFLYS